MKKPGSRPALRNRCVIRAVSVDLPNEPATTILSRALREEAEIFRKRVKRHAARLQRRELWIVCAFEFRAGADDREIDIARNIRGLEAREIFHAEPVEIGRDRRVNAFVRAGDFMALG